MRFLIASGVISALVLLLALLWTRLQRLLYLLPSNVSGEDPGSRLQRRFKNTYIEFESHGTFKDKYVPAVDATTFESRKKEEKLDETWEKIIGHGSFGPRVVPSAGLSAIAVYGGHDASIAVSIGGRVQCVLELERLFNVRYWGDQEYDGNDDDYLKAVTAIRDHCECDGGMACPTRFDTGVILRGCGLDKMKPWARVIEKVFSVSQWEVVDHHYAHALVGFHASPFRSALVVSYDGGSEDGEFRVFYSNGNRTERIASLDYNLGFAYMALASLLPDVTGNSISKLCDYYQRLPNEVEYEFEFKMLLPTERMPRALSWAGKLMGYAATGKPDSELRDAVRQYLEKGMLRDFDGSYKQMEHSFPKELVHALCSSPQPEQIQRDLGATIQSEFEKMAYKVVEELIYYARETKIEGIVLTGGCALNVLANQAIYDGLVQNSSKSIGMYVPASPHDGGLTVGGLWAVMPPTSRHALQYTGFRLWDASTLDNVAQLRGAKSLSMLGGVDYLAKLLAGQTVDNHTTDKPIIAVVRGRQEYGPRALGHRSILAVPDSDAIRDRMNRLKFRQWYRPVAPMLADEAMEEVFGRKVKSPYMTMAPIVREHIRTRFPALAHLDGTARHQSIGKADEPWVHALLLAVGKLTGLAALINTSFNTRGKPIVNTIVECLEMLDTLPDLDFVLIEDWLFEKPADKMKH